MSKVNFKSPVVILLAAIALAVLLVATRQPPVIDHPEARVLLVDVVEVAMTDQRIDINAQGVVAPRSRTELVAKISGRVVSMSANFVVGGFFRQGDVLFRLDDADYVAQLSRARAGVAQAEALLAQEKGRSRVAETEWKQRNHPDTVSQEAKALALRQPQLREAQAQLEASKAELRRSKQDLEETVVRAPYASMVSSKLVEMGQYVRTGASMGELFAVDVAEIRLPVPESKLGYLQLPNPQQPFDMRNAKVELDYLYGDKMQRWEGELVRTEGVLDAKSRVLYAVARVNDPYGLSDLSGERAEMPLRMGSFVDAHIEGRVFENLVKLPRDILRPGNKVWVVDQNNLLQEKQVEVLRTDGKDMYVSAGLVERDLVCLTSLGPVLAGSPVKIVSSTSQMNTTSVGGKPEAQPATGHNNLGDTVPEAGMVPL